MATFSDTYATNAATLGTLGDSRDGRGVPMIIPFNMVVPTTPGTGPTFNLGVTIPIGFKPKLVVMMTNGLSASATVNLTVTLGDAGDASRLASAQDFDLAASFLGLDPKAYDYEYTSETQLTATVLAGKTPVTGQKLNGFLFGVARKAA